MIRGKVWSWFTCLLPHGGGGGVERKVSNANNIAVFSLALRRPGKMTPEHGNHGLSGIDASFGKLADFAGALSKGGHVAIQGELRNHEYQREVAVGAQRTSIPQRAWKIRVDSVLKLDRAVKRESNDNSYEEVPR